VVVVRHVVGMKRPEPVRPRPVPCLGDESVDAHLLAGDAHAGISVRVVVSKCDVEWQHLTDLLRMVPAPYNELIWQPSYAPSPPPNFNPATIAGQLVLGAQQGVTDAPVDAGVLPHSYYATTYPAISDVAEMTAVAQ
jgi:hypothetical protein